MRFKQSFERLQTKTSLHFIPLTDESIYQDYSFLNQEETQKTLHLVDENLNLLRGAEAIEYLLKNHPHSGPFLWLIESESGKKAVDYFYKKANSLREAIKAHCPGCP